MDPFGAEDDHRHGIQADKAADPRGLPPPRDAVCPAAQARGVGEQLPPRVAPADVEASGVQRPVRRTLRPPWRFASPSFMVLALLLSPLPWLEVRCEQESGRSEAVVEQSGLEATFGTFRPVRHPKETDAAYQARTRQLEGAITVQPAPLLLAYLLALLLGAVGGFALPAGWPRRWSLTAVAGGAVALLAMQLALGFPLARRSDLNGAPVTGSAYVKGPDGVKRPIIYGTWRVRFTPWFWLTLTATLGAAASAGLEVVFRPGGRLTRARPGVCATGQPPLGQG